MRLGRIVGRVTCSRQTPCADGKKLLLVQPLRWEDAAPAGDPVVAADAVGSGASELVFWVASREAIAAFEDAPCVDAAVVGIVDGCHFPPPAGEASSRGGLEPSAQGV
ncbi:MAG: EutN/CcmL family microcompartment protein [Elusimicrobia bacterium]|nr:EutN/CcmL family microcompartment protein [Elusimicrobiota bacterium]